MGKENNKMQEHLIAFVAVVISFSTLILNFLANKTKANADFVRDLKSEVKDLEHRIDKLEYLLKICEAERGSLKEDYMKAVLKITKLEEQLTKHGVK